MNTETKKWYASKTLWVAVISIIIGILSYLKGSIEAGNVLTVEGVVMGILRLITNKGIK